MTNTQFKNGHSIIDGVPYYIKARVRFYAEKGNKYVRIGRSSTFFLASNFNNALGNAVYNAMFKLTSDIGIKPYNIESFTVEDYEVIHLRSYGREKYRLRKKSDNSYSLTREMRGRSIKEEAKVKTISAEEEKTASDKAKKEIYTMRDALKKKRRRNALKKKRRRKAVR